MCQIEVIMADNTGKYKKLKVEAKRLFVTDGLTASEISIRLGISKKTMSIWVNENEQAWKKEREARMQSTTKQGDNIRAIISELAERRLAIMRQVEEIETKIANLNGKGKEADVIAMRNQILDLRKQSVNIADETSKWNKALNESYKGNNRITLSIYLEVMDSIFDYLRKWNPDIYNQTIDFQEQLLNEQSRILG